MKVGGFNYLSTIDTNNEGMSFVIYFQGCSRNCPGCHNPELQPFNCGRDMTVGQIIQEVEKNKDWYKAVVLQGGEPLQQDMLELKLLIRKIKLLGLEAWLYTGNNLDEIPKSIFDVCDVIVAGAYVEELNTGSFPASSNQIIYDSRRDIVWW